MKFFKVTLLSQAIVLAAFSTGSNAQLLNGVVNGVGDLGGQVVSGVNGVVGGLTGSSTTHYSNDHTKSHHSTHYTHASQTSYSHTHYSKPSSTSYSSYNSASSSINYPSSNGAGGAFWSISTAFVGATIADAILL